VIGDGTIAVRILVAATVRGCGRSGAGLKPLEW
jgi:hypothetical protein